MKDTNRLIDEAIETEEDRELGAKIKSVFHEALLEAEGKLWEILCDASKEARDEGRLARDDVGFIANESNLALLRLIKSGLK